MTTTEDTTEDTSDRLKRSLKTRKSFNEPVVPSITDRVGDPDLGSKSRGDLDTAKADYNNGIYLDDKGDPVAGTGDNVAYTTGDSIAGAGNRPSSSPSTSSIVDRTDGWGHRDAGANDDRQDPEPEPDDDDEGDEGEPVL